MKAAVLFSGGKDSCLALYKAIKQGYEVEYLLSIIPESKDSMMWHKPNIKLLKEQARQLGIKLIVQKSTGKDEDKLRALISLISKIKGKADTLVIGGIASNYQGQRIKKAAEKFGMNIYSPLWKYSSEKLWNELMKERFKVILTKIACEGIPKEFLGKIIDKEKFEKLKHLAGKYKFDLSGEGGDFESAVLYCPLFKKEIKVKGKIISESDYRHFFVFNT
jgi:ABC transporter with metal-binding/Fe-S-binding domain ATP-binding protein